MRTRTVVAAGLLALVACSKRSSEPPPPPSAPPPALPPTGDAAIASALVTHLARGETAAALAMMPGAPLAVDELARQWSARAGDGGPLRSVTARAFPEDPAVFSVRAELERGMIDSLVVVGHGVVTRLNAGWLYQPPAYVDRAAFTDHDLAVGTGTTALPGVLSVPRGAGPFPVVVLLQGSGPSDLDEGDPSSPVLLFRDLAWGLASHGVAVLRFDKRSWPLHFTELGVPIDRFTVQHEYFDPLAAALTAVAADPRVDRTRIFVLGHSQAGWLLPWMLRDHPEVAGGIIASGCARPMVDLLPEQTRYLASLDARISALQLEIIDKLTQEQVARAHDPALADDTPPTQLPLGIPAAYWKFLQGYDAPAVLATLTRPVLVVQGGRDYNVGLGDLDRWRAALAHHPDATVKEYPDLEHHYLAGTGKATPAEIFRPGHADRAVIDDVAAWVQRHRGGSGRPDGRSGKVVTTPG